MNQVKIMWSECESHISNLLVWIKINCSRGITLACLVSFLTQICNKPCICNLAIPFGHSSVYDIPEPSESLGISILAGNETRGGASGYIDSQSCLRHINNCSSSKDNSTQGTNSCQEIIRFRKPEPNYPEGLGPHCRCRVKIANKNREFSTFNIFYYNCRTPSKFISSPMSVLYVCTSMSLKGLPSNLGQEDLEARIAHY